MADPTEMNDSGKPDEADVVDLWPPHGRDEGEKDADKPAAETLPAKREEPAKAPDPPYVPEVAATPRKPKKPFWTAVLDNVLAAPFYLAVLVLGWCLASVVRGNGFGCPPWLFWLFLLVLLAGVAGCVAFRRRLSHPGLYGAAFVVLGVLAVLVVSRDSMEERTVVKQLETWAEGQEAATGAKISVGSTNLRENPDGSWSGTVAVSSDTGWSGLLPVTRVWKESPEDGGRYKAEFDEGKLEAFGRLASPGATRQPASTSSSAPKAAPAPKPAPAPAGKPADKPAPAAG